MAKSKEFIPLSGSYIHSDGSCVTGYSSHKEHCFYEKTTKRQMFLMLEQFADFMKDEETEDWVDRCEREKIILKQNNIR